MADTKRVDTVRLDEKTLWKLHDKLKKIRAKEIAQESARIETKENETPQQQRRPRAKPARFQVYQPGVTRLSNRKLAANFDFAPSSGEKRTPERDSGDHRGGSGDRRQPDRSRLNESLPVSLKSGGRGRGTTRAFDRSRRFDQKRQDEDNGAEEGFLARHRRRKRNGENVENFSDDEVAKIDDDELAWDNYGSSGLVHGGWSPQVTGTETSSQEGVELSDNDLYEELSEDEKVADQKETDNKDKEAVASGGSQLSSDADVPSVATSESSKKYYKMAHNLSENEEESNVGSAEERGQQYAGTSEDEYEYEDEEELYEEEAPRTRGKPRKQLYDPNNPDSPIMVKRPPQGRRGQGQYNVATSGDNVYNPSLSKDRMMVNIRPARQRRRKSPNRNTPRYSSPPCYRGNYYPEEGQWQRGYDTPSPTGRNHRHPSENLSEDEDTVTSQVHNKRRQSCMSMLHEAEQHENMLSSILITPSFDSHEYTETLTRVRNKLKILYEGIIINDIETASKHNIEQLLWRNVYYQVIEILREQIRSCPEQEGSELKINLVLLLDQGTAFYESLLENLQHKYRFNLKEILNSASARKKHRTKARKRSKLAIVSCQRIFICLGDVARYREQANNSYNYGRARHCYLQAQILAPKNGRPYNQLAVLAVRTRHKLDAVFYYVRSLAASNPILSARESLMVLFDEIRRKLDYIQSKKDAAAAEKGMANLKVEEKKKSPRSRSNMGDESPRRWEEVWILPGEGDERTKSEAKGEKPATSDADMLELSLPLSDIAKHFVLLFLNAHGKLFTRIGLESFSEILTKTLRLFAVTLDNQHLMSSQRLLQLYAINLFAVLNADKLSIHGSVQDSTQNLHRALQLVFSMFAVTVEQTNKIFESCEGEFDPFACEHLQVLLPSVKIMFDWMYANKDSWYPPAKDLTDTGLNIWESLAKLCNWVCNHRCTKSTIEIYNEPADGLHEVFLSEDTQLAGFSPLGQAFSDARFVESQIMSSEKKSYLQQCVRMSLVRDFLEYLCGLEEPLLAFRQGRYVAVAPNRLSSWSDKSPHEDSFMSSDYDIVDDYAAPDGDRAFSSSEGNNNNIEQEHQQINELRMYRDSLQMKKELHEKRKNQIQSSLETDEKMKLEICPKYLVPDTNCFIDHLHLIQKLVSSGKFIVSSPLVVISELEGLAKESKGGSAHADNVHRNANAAVDFIKECFVSHNPRFCALTRRGTELNSIRFRSEESEKQGNNDDFILESTHAYASMHSKKTQSPSGEKVVHGSVVLLTDDRNLRLKALLLQDMATKDIVEFCRWVKL